MPTTIILVRHGQTEWNRVERFRGRYDVELNQDGKDQARKTALQIAKLSKPEAIYTSPLLRAVQTAEAISETCSKAVSIHAGLIDIDYGDWQGSTPQEAAEQWPIQVADWYKHPEKCVIPGGETLFEVQKRAFHSLHSLARRYDNHTIVLVSHTVVNRLILLQILGLGIGSFWHLGQDPCCTNIITIEDDFYFLKSMNETWHLEK